ncbi:Uncharacterized protein Fot_43424 [Forsythia ovata]|uniref:Uncharacterized protein n=1 Tax=Forsythia ovata TaxID=205694 RepID=A0ABD1RQS1_9LAMI
MVENANGEIGRLSAEVEQEKTKYSNTKEKLSLAGWERRLNGGGGTLHKGVVCKAAAKVAVHEDEMISCMSENPRFGNLQSEEKEYFSGSIVEERIQVEPGF